MIRDTVRYWNRWLVLEKRKREKERILDGSLGGAVWHGNANCLTHFCEQVCDATAVTVIDQTCVPLFQIDAATRVYGTRVPSGSRERAGVAFRVQLESSREYPSSSVFWRDARVTGTPKLTNRRPCNLPLNETTRASRGEARARLDPMYFFNCYLYSFNSFLFSFQAECRQPRLKRWSSSQG